jgi:hypothetical protein
MNPPQIIIELDDKPVEIKARIENDRWAVVAFAGAHSIRSNKLSVAGARDAFARCVVHSVIDIDLLDDDEHWMIADGIHAVEEAIQKVTNNFTI